MGQRNLPRNESKTIEHPTWRRGSSVLRMPGRSVGKSDRPLRDVVDCDVAADRFRARRLIRSIVPRQAFFAMPYWGNVGFRIALIQPYFRAKAGDRIRTGDVHLGKLAFYR